jgi:hypothetical protein
LVPTGSSRINVTAEHRDRVIALRWVAVHASTSELGALALFIVI